MKTEVRKVEIEREVYIAEDGTVFEDEDECIEHEYEMYENALNLYDPDYKKTTFEDCHFADLVTEEDVKMFHMVGKIYGLSSKGVDKPGLYMWVESFGRDSINWLDLEEAILKIWSVREGKNHDQT